jgi:hypothetical protein
VTEVAADVRVYQFKGDLWARAQRRKYVTTAGNPRGMLAGMSADELRKNTYFCSF